MIDVIQTGPEEFKAAKKLEFGAILLDGRKDVLLGIVLLKLDGQYYPIRVLEVRHTNYGRISIDEITIAILKYEYSEEEQVTYLFWRQP